MENGLVNFWNVVSSNTCLILHRVDLDLVHFLYSACQATASANFILPSNMPSYSNDPIPQSISLCSALEMQNFNLSSFNGPLETLSRLVPLAN